MSRAIAGTDLQWWLEIAFQGNRDALRFASLMVEAAGLWDDLIDKDQVIPPEEINRIMERLFVELPLNRFYSENFLALHPLIVAGILGWRASCELERTGAPHDLELAYGLRYTAAHILAQAALICHGGDIDRIMGILPDIYRRIMPERMEEYVNGIKDRQ